MSLSSAIVTLPDEVVGGMCILAVLGVGSFGLYYLSTPGKETASCDALNIYSGLSNRELYLNWIDGGACSSGDCDGPTTHSTLTFLADADDMQSGWQVLDPETSEEIANGTLTCKQDDGSCTMGSDALSIESTSNCNITIKELLDHAARRSQEANEHLLRSEDTSLPAGATTTSSNMFWTAGKKLVDMMPTINPKIFG